MNSLDLHTSEFLRHRQVRRLGFGRSADRIGWTPACPRRPWATENRQAGLMVNARYQHFCSVLLLLFGLVATACGLHIAASPVMAKDTPVQLPVDPQVQKLVTQVALQVIPHTYEDRKKWGQQRRVLGGLYVKREGLRLKTHRTWKMVNHGTWTRYRIELRDPRRQFQVNVQDLQYRQDGQVSFRIRCLAPLSVFGRLSQWQHGVQLASLSVEAEADVELSMQCQIATRWELDDLQPTLVVRPIVQDAQMRLQRFRLQRVSQLHGPLVKSLSHGVREILEDQIAHRREKIVKKLNEQIARQEKLLRWSLGAGVQKLLAADQRREEPGDGASRREATGED
jgi:hypothetical protein